MKVKVKEGSNRKMEISIKNYKNIKQTELEIDTKKINFLFGISGSGKSSLANALVKPIEDMDKKIKEMGDTVIKVNNKIVNNNEYRLYCENSVNDLVVSQIDEKGIYNVFFDDEKQLEKIREDYNMQIAELKELFPIIDDFKLKIATIEKDISSAITQKDQFKKTAKVLKVRTDLDKIKREDMKELETLGSDYIDWKLNGLNFEPYTKGICPFCGEKIEEKLKKYIDKLKNITPKNFKNLIESPTLMIVEELGIPNPDFFNKEEYDNYISKLINLSIIKKELTKITDFVYFNNNIDIDPNNIIKLEINDLVYERFPELRDVVGIINNNINEIKIILGNLKREFDRNIEKNMKIVNNNLLRLGIPYEFQRNTINYIEKNATYILKHIDDDKIQNRTNGLSYGEKNILSLLLFMIINDNKVLIIDDPVSSYDEYRRKTIFNLLYQFQKERTILVLSHDQVFTKFAVYFSNKGFNKIKLNTGKIIAFENYNGIPEIININFDDFKPIEELVKTQLVNIGNKDYYRRIVNIKILSELKKFEGKDNNLIYKYISSILHQNSKKTILEKISQESLTEKEIILKIKQILGVNIDKIPDNYQNNICFDKWTNFEIAIAKRERIVDKIIREELNNIVHLNDAYAISLNPYKYDYFSPYIYNIISENKKSLTIETIK